MKYGYEIEADGTRMVHVFGGEAARTEWIAASPSNRGALSGSSKEVKTALYRQTAIFGIGGEQKL